MTGRDTDHTWTEAENEALLRDRAAGVAFAVLAARHGVCETTIRVKIHKLKKRNENRARKLAEKAARHAAGRSMIGIRRAWTDADRATLRSRAADGEALAVIARDLDRTIDALRAQLNAPDEAATLARVAARHALAKLPPRPLPHTSLAAAWLGDPPPGRSAFDKRSSTPTTGDNHASDY